MSDPADELLGQILLGKIEVLRKLGGGGMGVVYEVEHRLTGHRRALKVVHAKYADRPRFMKRLLREAKVAGTLNCPYVVETYDAGRLEDGAAYVLMELLHGRTLYELMQEEGRLAPRRLAEIMSQLSEGMAMAHAAGIVHRDLKPENIFIVQDEDGERVKILDFGVSKFETGGEALARLTVEGTLVGTPYYMSPEQAAGRPVDARSDVYAMGVIMYEGLTGRLPFEAESVGALFVKIGAGECIPLAVRRPDLDPKWAEIVHRAFHRVPEERFESAEAMRRELLPLLVGGATAARAKTISDGVRPVAPMDVEVPRPPRVPVIDAELIPPSDDDDEDDEIQAFPPPPEPARTAAKRKLPAWAWAVAGVGLVLIIVVPWQLATIDEAPPRETAAVSPIPPPVEHEPTTSAPSRPIAEERRTPLAEEPVQIAAAPRDAGVAAAPPSRANEEEEHPIRRITKTRRNGLDNDPYAGRRQR